MSLRVRHIAAVVDWADTSRTAPRQATALARCIGHTEIALIVDDGDADASPKSDELRAWLEKGSGIHASVRPAGAYLRDVQSRRGGRPDLVVLNERASPLSRFLLRTRRHAVLIARHPGPASGFKRILVPTNFSSEANGALATAAEVSGEHARIDLVHCRSVESLFPGAIAPSVRSHFLTIFGKATRRGEKLAARHSTTTRRVRYIEAETTPYPGIRERLDQEPYDLVVFGVRRFTIPLTWLFEGNLVATLAREAHCSVLIVPLAARESDHRR